MCKGETFPAAAPPPEPGRYRLRPDHARDRASHQEERPIQAVLDPYNPRGLDGARPVHDVEDHPVANEGRPLPRERRDLRQQLGTRVLPGRRSPPERSGLRQEPRARFRSAVPVPVRIANVRAGLHRPRDDGRGEDDLLNLVVEIKGYRGEDAKEKADTMNKYWVPGVNALGTYGRWDFRRVHGRLHDRAGIRGEGRRGVRRRRRPRGRKKSSGVNVRPRGQRQRADRERTSSR